MRTFASRFYNSVNALMLAFKNTGKSTWSNNKFENCDAIIPFFQPIICCFSGNLIGVEVLARLRDRKQKSACFPSNLINCDTSLNAFNNITEVLLKRMLMLISLGQFKVINGCFFNLNISPKQIGNEFATELLLSYSEKLSFYGYQLNIEITETHEITNYNQANRFINELSKFGIDTYLDDYGKGFSSPLLLKHLNIAGLKIDKGFVYDIEDCHFSRNFILQTARQAQARGLKIIVEGVENAAQHRIIRELGVDFTQGYLHGKPAPLHFIDDYYSRFMVMPPIS